jgi:hypothetical protein
MEVNHGTYDHELLYSAAVHVRKEKRLPPCSYSRPMEVNISITWRACEASLLRTVVGKYGLQSVATRRLTRGWERTVYFGTCMTTQRFGFR